MMTAWIGQLHRLGLFACLISAVGCQDRMSGDAPPDPVARSGSPSLVGEWRWVASERAGQVIRPTGPSDSTTFEVGPLGIYREDTGGSLLSGRFSLAEGRLYQTRDTVFTVLVLDSSRFFNPTANSPPSIAVRTRQGE
jgi:hypothetical protein